MKQTLTTFILLIFCFSGFSQTYSLKGKVISTENTAIPFANVLLLNAADSTFVKGTSADDSGMFEFLAVAPNLYLLQASYVGNNATPIAIDIKKDITIGAIVIPEAANTLDEVTVTAAKPRIERLNDRLVFKVENTVISQPQILGIFCAIHLVSIVNSDELTIRGKNATVYIK